MVSSTNKVPVAIIGMASIFSQARNLQEYWDNIVKKIDTITDIPLSRWDKNQYYDPDPNAPDKTYCQRGAFIPDIEFDPAEFGLPPNILEVTDVSQLLGLVVARDALEDAGYGEGNPRYRESTGVILGFGGTSTKLFTPLITRLQYPVWEKALKSSGLSDADAQKVIEKIKASYVGWEENAFPGILGNVIAGRIANRLDLGGTNCVVDAACASSLAATRMAVSELIEGHTDMMITGGVDTDNSINTFMCFSKTPAFSKSQFSRPFDAEADGMLAGEGLGMLVLKRLEDAERDGDRIYAVIRAIGTSSDGRYKSIYAPRPAGQVKALQRAYAEAGFEPTSVGLIEAHGTGTSAGDPAEFQSLKEVFLDPQRDQHGPQIALGSVKSQIAHTKAAAGSASLIKTSLALYHKVLPPTLHVTRPSPKMGIEDTPFYINTETRPWIQPADGRPRRAGVSAFGFGGTNFHVVLEEYQPENTHQAYRVQSVPYSLIWSAPTPAELIKTLQATLSAWSADDGKKAFQNHAIASNRLVPGPAEARLGLVAEDVDEGQMLLKTALETLQGKPDDVAWENPKGIYYRRNGLETEGKVVATFSGQGSQYVDMGREIALNFPEIRQAFQTIDQHFTQDGKRPLSGLVYPPPAFTPADKEEQDKTLQSTEHAQPAIGAMSVGLFKLLSSAGFKADFTAGHSFGELTALWAAGVISEEDYFSLAKARGKAMAAPDDPAFDAGAMLAVKGSGEQVGALLKDFPDIILANWNSNTQVVLAGPKQAIAQIQDFLTSHGYSVVLLPVSAAFHTPLVGHAQKPFSQAIASVPFHAPKVPVYSNSTGKKHASDPSAIQTALSHHILKPVLFRDEIESIYADGGRIFVEFGPKSVITGLVHSILGDRPHLAVALNANPKKNGDRQLREAVMILRVAGLPLPDFDPYRRIDQKPPKKKSGIKIMLNGGFYISEKTRLSMEKALNDGFKVTSGNPPEHTPMRVNPDPLPVETQSNSRSLMGTHESPKSTSQPARIEPVIPGFPLAEANDSTLDILLSNLVAQQNTLAHTHEQYLANETEYTRAFSQISLQEAGLVSGAASDVQALEQINAALKTLEQSLDQFHQHQSETSRVHAAYLENQMEVSQSLVSLLQGNTQGQPVVTRAIPAPKPATPVAGPKPIAAMPVPASPSPAPVHAPKTAPAPAQPQSIPMPPAQPEIPPKAPAPAPAIDIIPQAATLSISIETIAQALMEVVSEKTGYPVEMLEPSMDMEADLGIDSIKRVEIMGAMQERFPQLPKVDPEALAEMRTLEQIIHHLGQGLSALPTQTPVPAQAVPMTQALTSPQTVDAAPTNISNDVIAQALMEVVSEKTGYPVEMLEPTMDMEADLGIDSIKRVEILGAMQERFPQLPKIEPEALAEMRTLAQITGHLAQGAPAPHDSAEDQTAQPILDQATGQPAYIGRSEATADVHPFEGEGQFFTLEPGIERDLVTLKTLPEPDSLNFSLKDGTICLVTDDGTPTTSEMVQELIGRGWKTAVLKFPGDLLPQSSSLFPETVPQFQLTGLGEADLIKTLGDIRNQCGPVSVFIHLSPFHGGQASQSDSRVEFSQAEKDVLKLVFLMAKHLKDELNQVTPDGRSAFIAVTRLDGEFGLGHEGIERPTSGGLFGLVKTLNLEWEPVFCRAIDLDPRMGAASAAHIVLAELHDPNRLITEVGYNSHGRATLVLTRQK